jgi:tRNA (guanine-N7-)-methyltransferase
MTVAASCDEQCHAEAESIPPAVSGYINDYFCRPMGQKKLQRFAEIRSFSNVLEYPAGMKGQWNTFFKNGRPILLELACGKGEYAVGLGRIHPEKNFLGLDIKGNRMWVGAKTALTEGLPNVAFLRTQIEKITDYFAENEVAEIWVTFPDPQLRFGKAKKRLTHPRFLRLYQAIMGKGGLVNLKTDSPDLYQFTKKVIHLFGLRLLVDLSNVYAEPVLHDDLKIQTHYEKLDIAKSQRVHYLKFALDQDLPVHLDEQLKQILIETTAG